MQSVQDLEEILCLALSNDQQTRSNAERTLMLYHGEQCSQQFISDIINTLYLSQNQTTKILALTLVKSRLQKDTFYSESHYQILIGELMKALFFFDNNPPSSPIIIQCLGAISIKSFKAMTLTLLDGFNVFQVGTFQFTKLLQIQNKVTQVLSKTYMITSQLHNVYKCYQALLAQLKQYFMKLQNIRDVRLATQAMQCMFSSKSMSFPFDLLFFMYGNIKLYQNNNNAQEINLTLRSFFNIFIKKFNYPDPTQSQKLKDEYNTMFLELTNNIESIQAYSPETLLAWIDLFNLVMRYLVTNKKGSSVFNEQQQNTLSQQILDKIFKMVIHAFNVSEDSNLQIISATSESIRIIKQYTDDTAIINYLRGLITQYSDNAQNANKSAYLYLLSNVVNQIEQPFTMVEYTIKEINDSPPDQSFIFAACCFLKSVLDSAQIYTSLVASTIHHTLLRLIDQNSDNIGVKNEIYSVVACYLHKSSEQQVIKHTINQLFRLIQKASSQQEVMSILQDLRVRKNQSRLIQQLIHLKVRTYLQQSIQIFIEPKLDNISMIGMYLCLLAQTVPNQQSTQSNTYQVIYQNMIQIQDLIIKQSIYKLMFELQKVSDGQLHWITNSNTLNKMLIHINKELITPSVVFPILIQCTYWKTELVELFCLELLSKERFIEKNIQFCGLIYIIALIRKKQMNQKLIYLTLQGLKDNTIPEIILFCLQLVTLKEDPSLLRQYPDSMITNILRSGISNAFQVVNKYCVMKSNNEDSLAQLQRAMEGLTIAEKHQIRDHKKHRIQRFHNYKIIFRYSFRTHSHRIQKLLEK